MTEKKLPRHKSVYILPNMITLTSLFIGLLGILWAIDGKFVYSAIAIIMSGIFDGLDGKVARMTHTSSAFGVQLDSLADLVVFGVSPALTMYLWQLQEMNNYGKVAMFLYIACGALRLARFNVQSEYASKKFFIGLPIPLAAVTLATFILFQKYMPTALLPYLDIIVLVHMYILALLMVSTVRFASFKEYSGFKAHPFGNIVMVVVLIGVIASRPQFLTYIVSLTYIGVGLFYTLYLLYRSFRGSRKEKQA